MKLIHWVETHIGRSRRKTKKERGKEGDAVGREEAEVDSQEDPSSSPQTPVPEPRAGHDPPCQPRTDAPTSPPPAKEGAAGAVRKVPSIRTSFLEPTSFGGGVGEALSPRQRSLIRTNPWLPSPRTSCDSSADSGLACCARSSSSSSSSSGSDSSNINGSVFEGLASQRPDWSSLCSLRTSRDFEALLRNSNPRSIASLGRGQQRAPLYVRETCSLPRGDWRLEPGGDPGSSDSDEAYSEASSELEDSVARMRLSDDDPGDLLTKGPEPGLQQPTDSAFVSDESCTASPSSETAATQESLENKVRRLRTERSIVEERMQEAREEDRIRREERLHLQSELMKHRRTLLLHTLRQLREELELQGRRLQVACSATWEIRRVSSDGGKTPD